MSVPLAKLGEVCEIRNGATPKTGNRAYWGGGVNWITPAEMGGLENPYVGSTARTLTQEGLASCSATLAPPNSVILSSRAPIGYVVINTVPMATNQGCKTVIPGPDVNYKYLYYFLLSSKSLLNDLGTGATFLELSARTLKSVDIPLPPVREQKRIAAVLDRTSGIVAKYSQKLEEVQIRQSELRRAHIDALLGSLDARSESLAEVCDVFTDGDWIESKDQSPAGIRLIQTGNIGNGVYRDRLEKARWISPATFDRLRCTELLPGDVVFSRLPEPVGRACLIPETGTKMITAVDCTVGRPNESVLLPRFLLLYASSGAYFREVQSMVTGTTRDRISRKNLGRVRIPIPSIATQQELLSAADRAEAGFVSLESSVERGLQCAEELSAAVLAAAFRGDL